MDEIKIQKIFLDTAQKLSDLSESPEEIMKMLAIYTTENLRRRDFPEELKNLIAPEILLNYLLGEKFHVNGEANIIEVNIATGDVKGKCEYHLFPSEKEKSKIFRDIQKGKRPKNPEEGLLFCIDSFGIGKVCYFAKGKPEPMFEEIVDFSRPIPSDVYCNKRDEFCPLYDVEIVYPIRFPKILDYIESDATSGWSEEKKERISKRIEEILKEEKDSLNFISELSKRNIEKYIR